MFYLVRTRVMDLSIYDLSDGEFRYQLEQTHSAIIPVGSLEQHGPHLPVSTDCVIAEHISKEAARKLKYFVFPVVPYGVSFEHSPMFNISVHDSTLSNILCDICISIAHLGIKKIVIINGHHGNMGVLQYVPQNTFEKMPPDSVGTCNQLLVFDQRKVRSCRRGGNFNFIGCKTNFGKDG